MDYCKFKYGIYGVVDDNGQYIPSSDTLHWDLPFAQNSKEWLTQISQFYAKLKQYAPDLKGMAKQGSIDDNSRYPEVFANVDGIMWEDTGGEYRSGASASWWMPQFYNTFTQVAWLNSVNKPIIARAELPAKTDPNYNNLLVNKFLTYEVFKTDNSFFGPSIGTTEIDPAEYADMKNALGRSIAAPESTPEAGSPYYNYQTNRLYSRKFEGGLVYLNWTGTKNKVITLPTDRTYYDPASGQAVTQITLPDICQTTAQNEVPDVPLCTPDSTIKRNTAYVVTAPAQRAAVPNVSPNGGSWSGGEATVTLESTTPGAGIR